VLSILPKHGLIMHQGGAAIVATPLMDSASGVVVDSFGSSIIVELGALGAHEATGAVSLFHHTGRESLMF
jgi:hypothetical protein